MTENDVSVEGAGEGDRVDDGDAEADRSTLLRSLISSPSPSTSVWHNETAHNVITGLSCYAPVAVGRVCDANNIPTYSDGELTEKPALREAKGDRRERVGT